MSAMGADEEHEELIARLMSEKLQEEAREYAEETKRKRESVVMNKANANFTSSQNDSNEYKKAVEQARAAAGNEYLRNVMGLGTNFDLRIKSAEEAASLRTADELRAKNNAFANAFGHNGNHWGSSWESTTAKTRCTEDMKTWGETRTKMNEEAKATTAATAKQVKEHKYLNPMFLGGPYDGSRLRVERTVTQRNLRDDEGRTHAYVERLFHSQPTQHGQSTVYRLFVLVSLTSEQIMTALVDGYAGYFADNA